MYGKQADGLGLAPAIIGAIVAAAASTTKAVIDYKTAGRAAQAQSVSLTQLHLDQQKKEMYLMMAAGGIVLIFVIAAMGR